MKRNGFTLVELLAVIALLALIMVIVGTRGFGAFNKAKENINKLEEENILEGARTFLVDVDKGFCNEDSSYSSVSCNFSNYENTEVSIPVGYIIKHYMGDGAKDCKSTTEDGEEIYLKVKIETKDGNTIGYNAKKANESDVICVN